MIIIPGLYNEIRISRNGAVPLIGMLPEIKPKGLPCGGRTGSPIACRQIHIPDRSEMDQSIHILIHIIAVVHTVPVEENLLNQPEFHQGLHVKQL